MGERSAAQIVEFPPQQRCWVVLRTKPRSERVAVEHLALRGVEPYCPMFLEPPWHQRAPRGPSPLFSGYVFVFCQPALDLNTVRFCPAVLAPLSFAGRLALVDEEMIASLRRREGECGYIAAVEVERGIPDGGMVRIMDGPLRGLEGIFKGYLRGRDRARVLAEFLRHRMVIEVESDSLRLLRA